MASFSLRWLFVGFAFIGLGICAVQDGCSFSQWATNMVLFIVLAVSSVYAVVTKGKAVFALGVALTCFARNFTGYDWQDDFMRNLFWSDEAAESLGGDYYLFVNHRSSITTALITLLLAVAVGLFAQWIASREKEV